VVRIQAERSIPALRLARRIVLSSSLDSLNAAKTPFTSPRGSGGRPRVRRVFGVVLVLVLMCESYGFQFNSKSKNVLRFIHRSLTAFSARRFLHRMKLGFALIVAGETSTASAPVQDVSEGWIGITLLFLSLVQPDVGIRLLAENVLLIPLPKSVQTLGKAIAGLDAIARKSPAIHYEVIFLPQPLESFSNTSPEGTPPSCAGTAP
jgi:hypothetical protein